MQNKINEVLPFKALHYNPQAVTDIGRCLSQPYDVISPEKQEMYYKQHPYNIIRLILNKTEPEDNAESNPYTRALAYYTEWKEKQILTTSHHPAFWVYEQEYSVPGMGKKKLKGFIGLVKLADFEEMRILPHEKILKGALEDRIKLTQTTHSQLEYIWGVYRDKRYTIDSLLEECEQQIPVINYYEADYDVNHKLWQLADSEKTGVIHEVMSGNKIYIADGHHRYNTMLAIRNEMRTRFPDAGEKAPWEYIMMYLTNSEHEGLTVLPTHRMVHDLKAVDMDKILTAIAGYFTVEKISGTDDKDTLQKQWLAGMQTSGADQHKIGMYRGNQYYILTLKEPEKYCSLYKQEHSREWMFLDVNILNTLVFEQILGITEEQLALNTNIKYTVKAEEAVAGVDSSRMQFAFILNGTRFEDVIAVSDHKEVMPRKSTFFYPKPVSGLVIYPME